MSTSLISATNCIIVYVTCQINWDLLYLEKSEVVERRMNCQSCGSEMPDGICETLGCADGLYRQLPAVIDPDKAVEEGQLEGLFPVKSEHEPRYKFLSYRYQGFTLKESQQKSAVTIQQIMYWRRMDPQFRELEQGLLGPQRNQIRKEIFGLAYLRNYALILEKDFTVLQKDAELGQEILTKEEAAYLRRIRQFYTPVPDAKYAAVD